MYSMQRAGSRKVPVFLESQRRVAVWQLFECAFVVTTTFHPFAAIFFANNLQNRNVSDR